MRTACNEIDKSDITVTLDSMSNAQNYIQIMTKYNHSNFDTGEGIVDDAGDFCAPQGGAFEWDFGLEHLKFCPTQSSQLQLKC